MGEGYRPVRAASKGISRRAALALAAGATGLGWEASAHAVPAPLRLPSSDLLAYRNWRGHLRVAQTPSQWNYRRREILRGFRAIAGELPEWTDRRRPPAWERLRVEVADGFERWTIQYDAGPGGPVPAYLLVPSGDRRRRRFPVALCLHQTHAAGNRVVVGLGASPDDEYGVELARRGWVCLAPAYPLLADYEPDLAAGGWPSGTLKAVWDNQRGLDLVETFSWVRRGPVAAIGHSLGGHNSIFTAVLDPRIGAVVTSCAFDSFADYMNGDLTGWTQTRYLPRLREYLGRPGEVPFDFGELIATLAPRALLAYAPVGDTNFRWQSVARLVTAARPVYELHRAGDRLQVRHPEGGHRFPPAERKEAYEFMERELGVAS